MTPDAVLRAWDWLVAELRRDYAQWVITDDAGTMRAVCGRRVLTGQSPDDLRERLEEEEGRLR